MLFLISPWKKLNVAGYSNVISYIFILIFHYIGENLEKIILVGNQLRLLPYQGTHEVRIYQC